MCDNCGACEACDLKRSHKTINIFGDAGNPDMAPTYKLTYFPIRGLAEPLRFLMSYGGIEFEDVRCESENWPALKPSMPFGQLPVLEIDGKKFAQSVAIARYLAKKVKLAGKDDLEDLEIDAIVDTINDLRQKIAMYHYEDNAAIKETRKETLFKETIPYYLERLDAVAKKNGGYFALGKITWADVHFAAILDTMKFHSGKADLIAQYPNLQKVAHHAVSLPGIKEWIAKRPKTDV